MDVGCAGRRAGGGEGGGLERLTVGERSVAPF